MMYFRRAVTSIRVDFPSGSVPTMQVLLDFPVEQFNRTVRADAPPMLARHLAVRQRLDKILANHLAASLNLVVSSSLATDSALTFAASCDSMA